MIKLKKNIKILRFTRLTCDPRYEIDIKLKCLKITWKKN